MNSRILGLVAGRLGVAAMTLLIVSLVVFGATQMLPGDVAEILLGQAATPEAAAGLRQAMHLDQPALVEIAPGVEIKVHSQAILRVVDPVEGTVTEDEFIEAEASEAGYVGGVASGEITSISDDYARPRDAETVVDPDADSDTKPKA